MKICFWRFVRVPYHLILAPEHKKTRLAAGPYVVAVRLVLLNLVHEHFKRWLAAIVGIGLHAQPDCVATTGFHNKVSTVPESPWPKLDVEQKFEIQIQNFNRFFCNRFWNDFFVQNVVRKQVQIWNLVLIFDPGQGYNFVAIQLFLFHDPIII